MQTKFAIHDSKAVNSRRQAINEIFNSWRSQFIIWVRRGRRTVHIA